MPRRRIMDYLMSRDGRNPYGSRGGYITSRDPRDRRMHRMGMRDRAMMGGEDYNHEEMGYEYNRPEMRDGHYEPIEIMGRFKGYYGDDDYARMGYRGRGRMDYNYGRDYGYGYDYAGGMLDDEDVEYWTEKMKREVEDKDKQFFTRENIRQKADQMGIKFDKFSLEEFMATVLMMYTDFCKTLGTANMDLYFRLAKDWLEDDDVAVKYGAKLATYYDTIVDPA